MRISFYKKTKAAALGLAITFTLSCSLVGGNDGGNGGGDKGNDIKNYKTVTIGSQVWMAENLNYNVNGSRCYNDSESNCNTYGRLYDWNTAKAVCPSGWHLPSKAEVEALVAALGGISAAGTQLKAKNGFYALPGGWGHPPSLFEDIGKVGTWWTSSTMCGGSSPYPVGLLYDQGTIFDWEGDCPSESNLFSVRCVKD